jgi:hypothetical protein
MKRAVALAALAAFVSSTARAGDQPPWMPGPMPPVRNEGARANEARQLRHDGAVFAGVGTALFAGGVALGVVALDIKQDDRTTMQLGGTLVTEHVYGAANWAELAGAIALMGGGLIMVIAGAQRLAQARRLEGY